jgi:DNA polymerase-1
LKELGWDMILQVHDEVVLEGPEKSAQEALRIVVMCMENPLKEKLKVKLEVDAKICNSWYEAK